MKRRDFLRGGAGLLAAAGGALVRPDAWPAAQVPRGPLELDFLHRPGPDELSVLLSGDTILYRGLEGAEEPGFAELLQVQRDADVAITNCELVFSREGYPHPKDVAWAPPEVATHLVSLGIDAVTVANNHLMDLGPDPMLETLDVLRDLGIEPSGGGADLDAATTPATLVRKGIRVGLLSFLCMPPPVGESSAATVEAPGLATVAGYPIRDVDASGAARRFIAPDERSLRILEDAVDRHRPGLDVLLVGFHMHWGDRYRVDDGRHIIARAAIDRGADLVFCHGPHVVNPVESYRGRFIFHSLGNFVFHIFEQNFFSGRYGANWPGITKRVYGFTTSTDFWEGLLPRLIVGRDGIRKVQVLPVLVDRDGDPRFPAPDRGRAIVEDLRTMSAGLGAVFELGDWHAEVYA